MISDERLQITGRNKAVQELVRLLNKGVNLLLDGTAGTGRSFVLRYCFEAFANADRQNCKPLYLKAYGTRRDFEEILFVMSSNNDIHDGECREQIFSEFRKGSQQQLERRILTGLKNADKPYLLFLEEKKRLPETMRLFLKEVLKTGKAVIIGEPADMADAKTRDFYQSFDRYEIRPLNDERMKALFAYLVRESSVQIPDEDLAEIRQRILGEVAGNPGRLEEFIRRGEKEREFRRDMVEKLPTSYRKELPIGWTLSLVVVGGMALRYFMRGSGQVTDAVMGGVVFAVSLLFYRMVSKAN